MAQIIMLGTGAALSDATRENTFLVVKGAKESILVDCAAVQLNDCSRPESIYINSTTSY